MEPLYSSNTEPQLWLMIPLILSAIFTLVTASSYDGKNKRKSAPIAIVAGAVIFLTSLIGIIVSVSAVSAEQDATVKDRINLIETTYGISVTKSVYQDLKYPRKAPEEGTFSSYGTVNLTVKKDGEIEQSAVTLVWNETEFQLASDEKGSDQLKELKRENDN